MTIILLTIIIALLLFALSTGPITRLAFVIKIFLKSGLLFIEKGFPFLGLSYVIVYVGAIAILFLFVIKLVPTSLFYPNHNPDQNPLYFLILLCTILGVIVAPVGPIGYIDKVLPENTTKLKLESWDLVLLEIYDKVLLGYYLFKPYFTTIYIVSLLLWVVLIGVLAITLKK